MSAFSLFSKQGKIWKCMDSREKGIGTRVEQRQISDMYAPSCRVAGHTSPVAQLWSPLNSLPRVSMIWTFCSKLCSALESCTEIQYLVLSFLLFYSIPSKFTFVKMQSTLRLFLGLFYYTLGKVRNFSAINVSVLIINQWGFISSSVLKVLHFKCTRSSSKNIQTCLQANGLF